MTLDKGFEYFASQGLGVVFGVGMLYLWLRDKKLTEKKLRDLLYERKADRDEQLRMLGRLEVHLRLSAIFQALTRDAMTGPGRRKSDRLLAELHAEREQVEAGNAGRGGLDDARKGDRERGAS